MPKSMMFWGRAIAAAVVILGAVLTANAEEPAFIIKAKNPEPAKLPTLAVYQDKTELRVAAAFPNVPEFSCDSWCYESEMDCVGVAALPGGAIELRHQDRNEPKIVYVTTVTPSPNAVEFLARAELAPGAKGSLPDKLASPNMCWQLKRAPSFASSPDPYPEFVKRCFIFTEKGRTFLNNTDRKLIPCRPATDKENTPPWVQMYVGTWQEVPKAQPTSWADTSDDRYVAQIIGVVSRDGKNLAAIVNDSAIGMSQAWHDCVHNNALWQPSNAAPDKRTWRMKVYVMENDPEALVNQAAKDFPTLRPVPVKTDVPKN